MTHPPAALPPWTPPEPRQLPEWRADLIDHHRSPMAAMSMAWAINAGHWSICPQVPGLDNSLGAVGAQLLLRQEAHMLERAALYYATEDMTALAVAAAETPPAERMDLRRLPAPAGLILFAAPIGGYDSDAAAVMAGTPAHRPGASAPVTTPIVAASWYTWHPGLISTDEYRVRWLAQQGGRTGVIPPEYHGVWVTFYSPRGLFAPMDPGTVIGTMDDGSPMTAGRIERERMPTAPPLQWDNEIIMAPGAEFGPPAPDTTDQWMHVLYTAWQLMGQQGRAQLAEVEEVPRPRAGQKRDRRAGITDGSSVRIVHVHSAHRPSRAAAEQDAAASTGRRAPHWSCRWPVRPHRRSHCMDPRGHADRACTHEDRIIPPYIKGPQGAPLRVRETVNVWDTPPGE